LERRRRDIVLEHVKGKLLDVGCGENRLVREYGNGVGVDVIDWGDVDLVVESSACLSFPDASFDTISFVACLNHIPERKEALQEARRLLRDEGILLVTMIPPFVSAVWHRLVHRWDPDQSHREHQGGEIWGFTAKAMTSLLEKSGFTLVARERFIAGLNSLYIAVKGPVRPAGSELE
jgi:ubiquinone/menaquinone biosynthesis C-methylase UbiE